MNVLRTWLSPANRCALLLWALLTALLMSLTAWELHATRSEAQQSLQADAQSMAARSARLLAVPAWEVNEVSARAIVMAEMEDSRVYALLVFDREGLLEGQRRNEHWEAVPWDDLVPDTMVEAECPLLLEDQKVGSVRLYLAPRLLEENLSALWWREMARFGITFTVLTLILAGCLWQGRNKLPEPPTERSPESPTERSPESPTEKAA